MRAFDADEDEVAVFRHVDPFDGHHRGLLVGAVVGERSEILHAGEPLGRGAHLRKIELSRTHQTKFLANAVRRREIWYR